MSGDNGKLKPNEEQPEESNPELSELELKKKAFEDNPDNFVSINDLILAVKRGKENIGIETYIGATNRTELEIALMRITHQAFGIFNAMSYAQQQSNTKIIKPKGNIMNFVRGGMKK